MSGPLKSLDRVLIQSVLETTIDQLAIVGSTLPGSGNRKGNKSSGYSNGEGEKGFVTHHNTTNEPLDQILLKEKKILQVKIKQAKKLHFNRSCVFVYFNRSA